MDSILEEKIVRANTLLAERNRIDAELAQIFGVSVTKAQVIEKKVPKKYKKRELKEKKIVVVETKSQGTGKRLSLEDRESIKMMIKGGTLASAIALEFGVSAPLIYMMKQKMRNDGELGSVVSERAI